MSVSAALNLVGCVETDYLCEIDYGAEILTYDTELIRARTSTLIIDGLSVIQDSLRELRAPFGFSELYEKWKAHLSADNRPQLTLIVVFDRSILKSMLSHGNALDDRVRARNYSTFHSRSSHPYDNSFSPEDPLLAESLCRNLANDLLRRNDFTHERIILDFNMQSPIQLSRTASTKYVDTPESEKLSTPDGFTAIDAIIGYIDKDVQTEVLMNRHRIRDTLFPIRVINNTDVYVAISDSVEDALINVLAYRHSFTKTHFRTPQFSLGLGFHLSNPWLQTVYQAIDIVKDVPDGQFALTSTTTQTLFNDQSLIDHLSDTISEQFLPSGTYDSTLSRAFDMFKTGLAWQIIDKPMHFTELYNGSVDALTRLSTISRANGTHGRYIADNGLFTELLDAIDQAIASFTKGRTMPDMFDEQGRVILADPDKSLSPMLSYIKRGMDTFVGRDVARAFATESFHVSSEAAFDDLKHAVRRSVFALHEMHFASSLGDMRLLTKLGTILKSRDPFGNATLDIRNEILLSPPVSLTGTQTGSQVGAWILERLPARQNMSSKLVEALVTQIGSVNDSMERTHFSHVELDTFLFVLIASVFDIGTMHWTPMAVLQPSERQALREHLDMFFALESVHRSTRIMQLYKLNFEEEAFTIFAQSIWALSSKNIRQRLEIRFPQAFPPTNPDVSDSFNTMFPRTHLSRWAVTQRTDLYTFLAVFEAFTFDLILRPRATKKRPILKVLFAFDPLRANHVFYRDSEGIDAPVQIHDLDVTNIVHKGTGAYSNATDFIRAYLGQADHRGVLLPREYWVRHILFVSTFRKVLDDSDAFLERAIGWLMNDHVEEITSKTHPQWRRWGDFYNDRMVGLQGASRTKRAYRIALLWDLFQSNAPNAEDRVYLLHQTLVDGTKRVYVTFQTEIEGAAHVQSSGEAPELPYVKEVRYIVREKQLLAIDIGPETHLDIPRFLYYVLSINGLYNKISSKSNTYGSLVNGLGSSKVRALLYPTLESALDVVAQVQTFINEDPELESIYTPFLTTIRTERLRLEPTDVRTFTRYYYEQLLAFLKRPIRGTVERRVLDAIFATRFNVKDVDLEKLREYAVKTDFLVLDWAQRDRFNGAIRSIVGAYPSMADVQLEFLYMRTSDDSFGLPGNIDDTLLERLGPDADHEIILDTLRYKDDPPPRDASRRLGPDVYLKQLNALKRDNRSKKGVQRIIYQMENLQQDTQVADILSETGSLEKVYEYLLREKHRRLPTTDEPIMEEYILRVYLDLFLARVNQVILFDTSLLLRQPISRVFKHVNYTLSSPEFNYNARVSKRDEEISNFIECIRILKDELFVESALVNRDTQSDTEKYEVNQDTTIKDLARTISRIEYAAITVHHVRIVDKKRFYSLEEFTITEHDDVQHEWHIIKITTAPSRWHYEPGLRSGTR